MEFVDILGLFGLQSTIVCGLAAWLGKVWANRINARETAKIQTEVEKLKADFGRKLARLNARNEPKVHVNKIQYEQEYSTYLSIWKLIPQLHDAINGLNSSSQSFDYYKEHLSTLRSLNSELSESVSGLYPFIQISIYDAALKCSNIISESYSLINEHRDYLESKAHGEVPPSKEREEEFSVLAEDLSKQFHNAGVHLGKSIKERNEGMIVL